MSSPEPMPEDILDPSWEAASELEQQLRDSCLRVLALTNEAHVLVKAGQQQRVESILQGLVALYANYEQKIRELGPEKNSRLWRLFKELETLIHGYRQSLIFTRPRVFKPGQY